ncbi:hypothetical protein SAMN04487895_11162 [Paenibacillus sophorae]|uniref:Uncharacterized protein n=1 Tax=Paenibacillus sophorae TaxID=1333845 RepID=A0A1H8S9U1_9BACL|nr:hypothetical protein [Paenibacillus sophorae]QWU16820.1 hypothetical protein KP014_06320 [Paenibacillus sophorae]SEO75286.1 hypothetical protein SAMN04487895_11162 [Paenibacillus sophorae]
MESELELKRQLKNIRDARGAKVFLKWDKTEEWDQEYKILTNVKSLLGSLYFRLRTSGPGDEGASIIEELRVRLMEPYL